MVLLGKNELLYALTNDRISGKIEHCLKLRKFNVLANFAECNVREEWIHTEAREKLGQDLKISFSITIQKKRNIKNPQNIDSSIIPIQMQATLKPADGNSLESKHGTG